MYKLYAMSQNMALNSCLYFHPDIGSERILQISQTCDHGRQFALKFLSCLKLTTIADTSHKIGRNCSEKNKLSFLNMQICHYTKFFLLGPYCVIIRLFLSFNIYICFHTPIFTAYIQK